MPSHRKKSQKEWVNAKSGHPKRAQHRNTRNEATKGARLRAWQRCARLAETEDILGVLAGRLEKDGLVGEKKNVMLLYLAVTTRFFDQPVSVAVKGSSSAGKSHLVDRVLNFFPASAFVTLTAGSKRSLVYSTESLVHRTLVIYEEHGMSDGDFTYIVRSLLSEGRIRYETVHGGSKGKVIDRAGPTGLITTTTSAQLHPENETRLLSVEAEESREQTSAIMMAQADAYVREPRVRGFDEWHALQDWLGMKPKGVLIPFAPSVAKLMNADAVRLRRDFPQVLALVRAHALIHQKNRTRRNGQVVASVKDYRAVRKLVGPIISRGVGRTVSRGVREVVAAVGELQERGKTVSLVELTAKLKIDKSNVSRHVGEAEKLGFLENLETRPGVRKKLVTARPLPDDTNILPSAKKVEARWRKERAKSGS